MKSGIRTTSERSLPFNRDRGIATLRPIVRGALLYVVLSAVAAVVLLPMVFAVLGGAKRNGQLVGDPVSLIPNPWVLTNYTDVLYGRASSLFSQEMTNSIAVAAVVVSLTLVVGSMATFMLARMAFRGREAVYTLFTLGLLFPTAVAILPLYIVIKQVGLSGNLMGVALPQVAFSLPLTVLILRPFFKAIPAELEDAARIDGCSTFGFFWRILLPLARPALATVSILVLVSTWNAFLLPLIVLGPAQTWTLPLGVMNYGGDAVHVLAYTVTASVPAVVFFLVAERQLVTGLTAGSVKG